MQENVSIGIGNGPFNDHTFAFSAEVGIANMSRTRSVVRFFGLDGTTSKVVWNTAGGNSSNETLIFEGQDLIWAQQGIPNVVRKKAVSAQPAALPTDLFFPEDLPVYFRSQGDYYYWISGDYGEPGYVYRRLRSAASDVAGTRIVDVAQGYAQDISGFAVTSDAIYWVTANDYNAATLDNDIRTTPLTGGVPTSVPKVAGASDAQIKDLGNFTIIPNLTAVGDAVYFARTIGESTLNGVYRYRQGDAAPTKIAEPKRSPRSRSAMTTSTTAYSTNKACGGPR